RAAYLSERYFAHESERVLAASWLCVAHVSQLPEIGSYLTLDLLDEPLVVVRGNDRVVRVLSRVCPHRAADILHDCFKTPDHAVTKRFQCP
ncbi:Rieske 2Fe-2S domain-containing protein, partial [Vibrio parahaemolyticus]